MAAKKILFLGHDASRTGAPIYQLHVLRWLKKNRDYDCELFLNRGGELESDFAELMPMTDLLTSCSRNYFERGLMIFSAHLPSAERWRKKIRNRILRAKPDLIFANSVAVANELSACASLDIPIIWQIHELSFVINDYNRTGNFDRAKNNITRFIASAGAVKNCLVHEHSIAPEKIELIHGFGQPDAPTARDKNVCRAKLRQELDLPADAFIVGMCGSVNWVKGVDWFLATAKNLAANFPQTKIHFAWLGCMDSELRERQVKFDLRKNGLASQVHFLPARPRSDEFLAGLDVFFLSSREDTFPLVMLEAAEQSVPILCFDGSGGATEFIQNGAGLSVEFGDIAAAAKVIAQLQSQPELRRRMGKAAQKRVRENFQLDGQVAKIAAQIDSLLA